MICDINLDNLDLSDDKGLSFDIEEDVEGEHDPNLSLVWHFRVNRTVHLRSMKVRMSEV